MVIISLFTVGRCEFNPDHFLTFTGARLCAGSSSQPSCPLGYQIRMDAASYGRDNPTSCGADFDPETFVSCFANRMVILTYLQELCDGQNSCEITTEGVSTATESCAGHQPYLHFNMSCVQPIHTYEACQEQSLTLACPDGLVMDIRDVFYGRNDNETCTDGGRISDTDCSSSTSLEIVSELCRHKNTCPLDVNWELLGDPCPGTDKYIQVKYTCAACDNEFGSHGRCYGWAARGDCESWSSTAGWMLAHCRAACNSCQYSNACEDIWLASSETCEEKAAKGRCQTDSEWMTNNCRRSCNRCGEQITEDPDTLPENTKMVTLCEARDGYLTCPDDEVISVHHVMFGRETEAICPSDSVKKTNCSGDDRAVHRVRFTCSGRQQCYVFPNARSMGGDTCEETYKYVQIYYTCDAASEVCVNQYYSDQKCDRWAGEGQCDLNPSWMLPNCYRSCACTDPDCSENQEDDGDCDYWSMWGECTGDTGSWMDENCYYGCRKCHVPYTGITNEETGDVTITRCEGEDISLTCDEDRHVHIISAFYGRQDSVTCAREGRDVTTPCAADDAALIKLLLLCEGAEDCEFEVGSDDHVDNQPCPGVYKYITVTYNCFEQEYFTDACEDNDCHDVGECLTRHLCICDEGRAGDTCEHYDCSHLDDCHGNGECVSGCDDDDEDCDDPNVCECDDLYSGDTCDVTTFTCSGVSNCSGHGKCVAQDTCLCDPYWRGDHCDLCDLDDVTSCRPCPICHQGVCEIDDTIIPPPAYVGCLDASDGQGGGLVHVAWQGPAVNTRECVELCYSSGYPYAGLQNGDTCRCGMEIIISIAHATSDMCDVTCVGGPDGDLCGSDVTISVWRTDYGECECERPWRGRHCDICDDPVCDLEEKMTQAARTVVEILKSGFKFNS